MDVKFWVLRWGTEPHSSAKPDDTLPRFCVLLLWVLSLEEMPSPVTRLRLTGNKKPGHDMQHQTPHAPHLKQHSTVMARGEATSVTRVITFSAQNQASPLPTTRTRNEYIKLESLMPVNIKFIALRNIILCTTVRINVAEQ